MLGYEREHRGKAAGVRTQCWSHRGCTLCSRASQAGVADTDLTRVHQGLIAGIGSWVAGTIIKGNHEEDVRGLTTAAEYGLRRPSVWQQEWEREITAILSALLTPHCVDSDAGVFEMVQDGLTLSRAKSQRRNPIQNRKPQKFSLLYAPQWIS